MPHLTRGRTVRAHRLASATLLAVLASLWATHPAGAATATLGVYDDYFNPKAVTIVAGDTISWHWYGSDHNVKVTGPESFTTPFHTSGADESHAFSTPGSYTFVCEAHGGMKGSFTVDPAPAPSPSPSPTPSPSPSPRPSPSPSPAPGSSPSPSAGTTSSGTSQTSPGATGSPDAGTPAVRAPGLMRGAAVRGGLLRVRLARRARIRISYMRTDAGRRVWHRITLRGHAGTNVFHLGRRMQSGRYRAIVVALSGGRASRPARLRFVMR